MKHEFKDGRLYLQRTAEERQPIVSRLAKIEGQVRGIRQMIEEGRYCGDEIQVANAAMSAIREVAMLIVSQHLTAGLQYASSNPDDQAVIDEITTLIRSAMKL